MRQYGWIFIIISGMMLTACGSQPVGPVPLTVMTHDSFSVSEGVVSEFEDMYGVDVVFVRAGDAGAALNRAILTRESPLADVFFGVDNTFLTRALDADIFEAYSSPLIKEIPTEFLEGLNGQVTPVDYGDVCINYDKSYFNEKGLKIPTSLDDLLNEEYGKRDGREGLLVVENPATSSPGLAFLLATIAEYGEDGYLDYWRKLHENGVVVVNDWDTAYYTNFSASSGQGSQPMVVSYATSPAAEVIYAATPITEAPTASLTGRNMCYRQVEYVGILKGTENRKLAEHFVDFMLMEEFQTDIPIQMLMYPVRRDVILPDEFTLFAQIPSEPAILDPDVISENREKWIKDWSEVMLR